MIWTVVAVLVCLASAIIFLKLYIKLSTGWDHSFTCLVGKTIIVTGANSGIGFVSAKEFAKRGARVILACRNVEKGNEAREKIINETQNENVVVKHLDLASFASVKKFAEDINETEKRVDVLLNNAGVGLSSNVTKDGFTETLQVNYLSTVLLTLLLIGMLKRSAPSRVVNVSSLISACAFFVNPDRIADYRIRTRVYASSKQCLIMFTQELAKTLRSAGISVFSLHPGVVDTKIYRETGKFWSAIIYFFIKIFFKSTLEGAQTQIYVSAAKGLEEDTGGHFEDCKKVANYRTTRSAEKRQRLWENTVKWLDIETNGEVSKIFKNISEGTKTNVIEISSHIQRGSKTRN